VASQGHSGARISLAQPLAAARARLPALGGCSPHPPRPPGPQGAQRRLLGLGQTPDAHDSESLVGPVATQGAQGFAAVHIPSFAWLPFWAHPQFR
jgi:hypothetical protein